MKKVSNPLSIVVCLILLVSCTNNNQSQRIHQDSSEEKISFSDSNEELQIHDNEEESSELTMNIQVGNKSFTAILYNNSSTKALIEKLPLTIEMGDMNGNEKYYFMDEDIPVDSYRPGKIKNGDIMLYGSNCLVIFYKTFNTVYSYTSLGYVSNPDEFIEAINEERGIVTFSIN